MKKLFALALIGLAASANATVLENGTLKVGVNNSGALIDHEAPTGIMFDPTGKGNYGAIDFIYPGIPFAFSSLGVNGSSIINDFGSTTTDLSALAGSPLARTSGGSYNGLSFTQLLSLDANTIHVTLTFKNQSSGALSNVVFATGFDADQDGNTFSNFNTSNSIVGQGAAAAVSATGPASGYTISLANASGWSATTASISSDWVTDPYSLSAGISDGNGDNTIALAYNLGNFNAGQSKTISYAISVTAVPEPSSLAMLLAGLGLMGVVARRRTA